MKTNDEVIDRRPGIPRWQHGAIFLIACAVVFSRRPDALTNPQFWAEDGHIWFADAYNLGWWDALLRPEVGYYQTLPRLVASLALLLPLSRAPLLLNLAALALQALPVNILLSSRLTAFGTTRFRALMAITYLVLPNCPEICANITNAQWVLALSALLLLVASPPIDNVGLCFDLLTVLLCGLTGPFCILLLPIAIYLAFKRHGAWRWMTSFVLVACSLIQAWGLLVVNPAARTSWGVLGATPGLFIRIIAGNIFFGALLGTNELAEVSRPWFFCFLLFIVIVGVAIVADAYVHSVIEMKLFILFAAMIVAASLLSPTAYALPGVTKWQQLAAASGVRYWFFPSLAFLWSLLLCAKSRASIGKIVPACLLLLLCFGIAFRWRRPAFQNLNFSEAAQRFEAVPEGTVAIFPENPSGWNMKLVKHRSR